VGAAGADTGTPSSVGTARAGAVATRIGLSVAAVALVTVALVAIDADLAFAAIALLLAVMGASTLGYTGGLGAALARPGLLNYYFTPPAHSFAIGQPDELLALVAYVAGSLLVAATVARLNQLRRHSDLAAREARLRLDVTNALGAGMPPSAAVDTVAHEMVTLFDLASCTVTSGSNRAVAHAERASVGELEVVSAPVTLRLELGRALQTGESETIAALAAGLATALDRTRLDAEAREQRLRADIDRSRAGFLTAVTHDLRTPLATIKGASGALLAPGSHLDDDERRELVEAVYDESMRLESLVTKVLELTRIRTGAVQPEPVTVAPADLVPVALERLGSPSRTRRITVNVDPDLPAVHVDVLLIEHVVVNLLENALLHDPTSGEITVVGTATNGHVELAVVDHGPGIPPADRQRVFDEFVRLRSATDGPGTGLGLAIVRSLVTASGGSVRYEDTPGGGSTFVISLPAASDDHDGPDDVLERP
jgi:two-component system sensor histidine kinase KdpD